MSYAQGITPRLAVGAESVYSFAEQGGAFSFGGKYNAKDWSAAAVAMHLGQVGHHTLCALMSEAQLRVALTFVIVMCPRMRSGSSSSTSGV